MLNDVIPFRTTLFTRNLIFTKIRKFQLSGAQKGRYLRGLRSTAIRKILQSVTDSCLNIPQKNETQRRRREYVMQFWFWHMAVRALSQRKHAVGSIYTVTHAFNVVVAVVAVVVREKCDHRTREARRRALASPKWATRYLNLVVYSRPRITTNYVITETRYQKWRAMR